MTTHNLPTVPVTSAQLKALESQGAPPSIGNDKRGIRWNEGPHTVVRDSTGFIFVAEERP